MKKLFCSLVTLLFSVHLIAADLTPPPTNTVIGVIGASYESGRASTTHPLSPNAWYLGGAYRTWVDKIPVLTAFLNYHWINYSRGGETSVQGNGQLTNLINETRWPDSPTTPPVTKINTLVIGSWGNDYIWYPYNQAIVDNMIQNINLQINMAKAEGIQKIIITGMPKWEDLDLLHFAMIFPVPGTIDEADYNAVKVAFYNAFAQANPDYVFADNWCNFKTFDGVHPDDATSLKSALKISNAIVHYDRYVNKAARTCN